MAITATSFSIPAQSASVAPKAKAGMFSRFLSALQASRHEAAKREIARHQHIIDQISSLRKPETVGRDALPF